MCEITFLYVWYIQLAKWSLCEYRKMMINFSPVKTYNIFVHKYSADGIMWPFCYPKLVPWGDCPLSPNYATGNFTTGTTNNAWHQYRGRRKKHKKSENRTNGYDEPKTCLHRNIRNFAKYWPIFEIFSLETWQ